METLIPQIPRSFINHADFKVVMDATLDAFGHEEKEAIFFFCVLGAAVHDISTATQLTPGHITSTLNLYAARLENKVRFFKKFMPHNDTELLNAGEYLFMDAPA
ncbi:MAG: hypothetical protein FWC71_09955 [Defluviitaleaceae bacterium]|nr:hypothetical protein [Defluviitaleaceae bacterium]